MSNTIPEGYMQNAQKHLVPINAVSDIDKLRNDVVIQLIQSATLARQELFEFKAQALDEIELFLETSAAKYNVKFGGKKGNISLVSFDGKYKVSIDVSDTIDFDERLQISKQLADECIIEEMGEANDFIKSLVLDAYQVDKKGCINRASIHKLLALEVDNKKWKEAMQILRESIFISSSKSYMRFYERTGPENKFKQISLDVSSL